MHFRLFCAKHVCTVENRGVDILSRKKFGDVNCFVERIKTENNIPIQKKS